MDKKKKNKILINLPRKNNVEVIVRSVVDPNDKKSKHSNSYIDKIIWGLIGIFALAFLDLFARKFNLGYLSYYEISSNVMLDNRKELVLLIFFIAIFIVLLFWNVIQIVAMFIEKRNKSMTDKIYDWTEKNKITFVTIIIVALFVYGLFALYSMYPLGQKTAENKKEYVIFNVSSGESSETYIVLGRTNGKYLCVKAYEFDIDEESSETYIFLGETNDKYLCINNEESSETYIFLGETNDKYLCINNNDYIITDLEDKNLKDVNIEKSENNSKDNGIEKKIINIIITIISPITATINPITAIINIIITIIKIIISIILDIINLYYI